MIELTTELENQFKKHSIDALKDKLWDNEVIAMFYYPAGSGTWLIVGAEQLGDDWLLYGYCHITDWEWGSVSFKELSNLEVHGYMIQNVIFQECITVQQFKDNFMQDQNMNYPFSDFSDKVIAYIKLQTSQECKELVRKEIVRKPNIVYESVNLPINKSYCLAVNLDETYEDYLKMPLSFVEYLNCLIYDYRHFAESRDSEFLNIKVGTIRGTLINSDKNIELLKDIPHRDFLDLSIIYYLDSAQRTITISNALATELGLNEEDLYNEAIKNSDNTVLLKASTFIKTDDYTRSYILTNQDGVKGSFSIFSDELKNLAARLEQNLYVLPCSIHNIVLVPEGTIPKEIILLMHKENGPDKDSDKFLSENVYYYSHITGEFSIVE